MLRKALIHERPDILRFLDSSEYGYTGGSTLKIYPGRSRESMSILDLQEDIQEYLKENKLGTSREVYDYIIVELFREEYKNIFLKEFGIQEYCPPETWWYKWKGGNIFFSRKEGETLISPIDLSYLLQRLLDIFPKTGFRVSFDDHYIRCDGYCGKRYYLRKFPDTWKEGSWFLSM